MSAWANIIGGPKVWARDLVVSTTIGLTLSLLGPFGSYDAPYLQRLLYCTGVGLAGSAVFFPAFRLVLAGLRRAGWPYGLALIAATLAAGIPVTLLVWWAGPFLWAGRWDHPGQGPYVLYAQVMSIILPFALAAGVIRWRMTPSPASAPSETPALPRLHARLPVTVGREIVALEAEDHYVRVHTDRGSTLLLMRMADAVDELDGLDGLRVHRSWWVARAAVRTCAREGRRMVLTLSNGIAAPVTREAVPELRRAGWV